MCLVLFAWLSDQMYFKEVTDINTIFKLREKSDQQMMDELTPFGFYDDGGLEEVEQIQNNSAAFDIQDYITQGNYDNY
jgi:hypothetical protein